MFYSWIIHSNTYWLFSNGWKTGFMVNCELKILAIKSFFLFAFCFSKKLID